MRQEAYEQMQAQTRMLARIVQRLPPCDAETLQGALSAGMQLSHCVGLACYWRDGKYIHVGKDGVEVKNKG